MSVRKINYFPFYDDHKSKKTYQIIMNFLLTGVIDTGAVSEVCGKFGVKEIEVHNALLSGDPHEQLAIAYHLIIDNKRMDEAAKAEIKDFYVASSPPPVIQAPLYPINDGSVS